MAEPTPALDAVARALHFASVKHNVLLAQTALTALADDEATTQRWEQVAAEALGKANSCGPGPCGYCNRTVRIVVAAIKAELRGEGQ